ncbi:alpha/beta hydrolase [Sphingomonas sp. MMS12-HWE2-04]|uniref:alpha/beta hydrolase n=1 Tax=Sphingomonas sp. MMS12-HWE2-04 TaxID=3234199 RepID=UPI00384C0AE4
MRRLLSGGIALALAIGTAPALAQAAPRPGAVAESLALKPGSETAIDGTPVPYEIGTLRVPENRTRPGRRTIGVGVLRIRARVPGQAPPVFLLAGGPGVTLLDTIGDKGPAARRRLRYWLDYAAGADLVIIEQRGFTLRGEMLQLHYPALPLDQPDTIDANIAVTQRLARAAAAEHPQRDLAGYTIAECADDVDAVRRLLGYDKISLLGASFGSQWSFAVMKRHPGTVARALISATEPLDNGYDMPSHVFAVLQRIAFEAESDSALRPLLPKEGLIGAARAIRDRLAAEPVKVTVPEGTIVLGLGDFQQSLLSYAVEAARWPAFVIDLYNGKYEGWARERIAARAAADSALIGPLIDTATGIDAAREHQLRTDPALDMLGSWGFAPYIASTGSWPTADLGDAFRLPVRDETPVLFVQGDWDANTPVENLLDVVPWFPNARTLIVHRGQHAGTLQLLRDRPDLFAAAMRFLNTGALDPALPSRIELAPVHFDVPSPKQAKSSG